MKEMKKNLRIVFKLKFLFVSLVFAVIFGFSCTQESSSSYSKSQSEGYGTLTIVLPQQTRDWTITDYEVVVNSQNVTKVAANQTGIIKVVLPIGTFQLMVLGKNSDAKIIYRGIANVSLTEDGTTVTLPLMQESGSAKLTVYDTSGYSVSGGQAGSIVKYVITAKMIGFPDIIKEVNKSGDSVVITDLLSGDWTFTVEGKAYGLNSDYSIKQNEFVTYLSDTTTDKILLNKIINSTLSVTKQIKVTPVIASVMSGTVADSTKVSLSCLTSGSVIKYKLGTDATADYSTQINITGVANSTIKLKVWAIKSGLTDSVIGEYNYTIADNNTTSSPQFNPIGGTYNAPVSVAITSETGADIYYTTDGTTPTTASTKYSTAIAVNSTITIKAIAKNGVKNPSDVISQTYTLEQLKVSIPVVIPSSGSYDTSKDFSIVCGTAGAEVYYTINGDIPSTASTKYTAPFKLTEGNKTVKTIGIKTGYANSEIGSESYTIIAPFTGIVVYFEKPDAWSKAFIWFDKDSNNTWETTVLGATPGDMVNYRTGWYKKEFSGISTVTFLFNDGTWNNKINDGGKDFVTTKSIWISKTGVKTETDPYAPKIPVIKATPAPGIYLTQQSVVLTGSNVNDIIYYTLDDSTPTKNSAIYTAPIVVTTPKRIKTFGVNEWNQSGEIVEFYYNIDVNADLEYPTVSSNVSVTTSETPIDVIFTIKDNKSATTTAYYTTDGTDPTTASQVYKAGDATGSGMAGNVINITSTTTIKFLIKDAYGNETKSMFYYRIGANTRADFREESIYFAITTRFYDGDSSTNVHCWDDAVAKNPDTDPAWRGDFKGLADKLDYIKALGFSAIWITPPVKNCSGYDYHGYHAINFKEIDPRYKTSQDSSAEEAYQKFIDACHAKGIKVIQDIVLNHSGNFGEENLFPLFKRNAPTGLNDTIASVTKMDTNNLLPADYDTILPGLQYQARIAAMKEDTKDTWFKYHHYKSLDWNSYAVQMGQIAGDCVDLNTENPTTINYLIDAYNKYIDMGVDSFRIDTVKHIPRLMFNTYFIPAFKQRGGDNFYTFGETCARYRGRWNEGVPAISPSFYTWKEDQTWTTGTYEQNRDSSAANFEAYKSNFAPAVTDNHKLNGNTYHTPDRSKASGLEQIDFPLHWAFANARDAFGTALFFDSDYNDATWNVTYIDSHDYAPDNAPENQRFAPPQDTWAENLALIFTFRGIPCLFYGSEIEFQKGKVIDVGPNAPMSQTGRAYFGDNIEGTISVTDFATYTGATGTMATTLSHPLAKHILRLNKIRRLVPALQKGQYSTDGVSGGGMAFKRRYVGKMNNGQTVDSFALVTISGDATFSGIPNGTYKDAITGNTINVTGGSLTASCSGKGNARIYVLDGSGKIGEDGVYLK